MPLFRVQKLEKRWTHPMLEHRRQGISLTQVILSVGSFSKTLRQGSLRVLVHKLQEYLLSGV